jgi:hypothetical protein
MRCEMGWRREKDGWDKDETIPGTARGGRRKVQHCDGVGGSGAQRFGAVRFLETDSLTHFHHKFDGQHNRTGFFDTVQHTQRNLFLAVQSPVVRQSNVCVSAKTAVQRASELQVKKKN